jgi:PPM family protein phosphatase
VLRVAETIERTDTGRQRRGNEDSSFARAPLFVVADGMGGAQAGEVASRIAVDTFARGLPDAGAAEERLATRVREANADIYERAHSEQDLAGMGTTLTAAYVDDTHVAIAHVGDSRAYLFRDGTLTRLTQDHSLVDELVRRGKLTEEEAAEHPQRSIITRALGPEPDVDVDTWTYPVRGGDLLLVCSDGLTSMVSEERVAEILGGTETLDSAAQALIDEANRAGGRDNITVILVRFEEVGTPVDGAGDQATAVDMAPPTKVVGEGEPEPHGSAGAPTPAPAATTTLQRDGVAGSDQATQAAAAGGPRLGAAVLERASATRRGVRRPPARRGQRRPLSKPVAVVVSVVIVLCLLGAGGYLASRQLYFIGTNSQGVVTIYRGLPYDLPAGIHLYETFYVSGVPASLIPRDRRASLLDNRLRSQSSAASVVRALELGRISK